MKRVLGLILAVASLGVFAETAQASVTRMNGATAPANAPQVRIQIGRGRHDWDRNNRTVRQTRIVRYGRGVYRETYLVRYFRDGRSQTTLLDRERIG